MMLKSKSGFYWITMCLVLLHTVDSTPVGSKLVFSGVNVKSNDVVQTSDGGFMLMGDYVDFATPDNPQWQSHKWHNLAHILVSTTIREKGDTRMPKSLAGHFFDPWLDSFGIGFPKQRRGRGCSGGFTTLPA